MGIPKHGEQEKATIYLSKVTMALFGAILFLIALVALLVVLAARRSVPFQDSHTKLATPIGRSRPAKPHRLAILMQ